MSRFQRHRNKLILLATLLTFYTACMEQEDLPPAPEPTLRPSNNVLPFPDSYSASTFQEWNDRVYYQIFVRSFYDSDGDGIGDLQGIIQKLDYLNDGDASTSSDLGVSGIWLMPINPSPSYHGYDVIDYYSVNPDYGSLNDLRTLITEAEKRGIRVIIDLVLNHTSTEHPWFQEAQAGDEKFRDYYIWENEKLNIKGPWGQEVWHRSKDNSYYYGLFWSGMPDLNYWNQQVTKEVYDITRFWLADVGVHGFRLDAIMYLKEEANTLLNTLSNHEWFQEYYSYYKGIAPHAFTIGEAWTRTEEAVKYIGSEVDVVFEFDLASAILNAVRNQSNAELIRKQEKILALYPHGQYGRFLSNHDQTRSASVLLNDAEKQKLAATILLTGPGIPFLYYGEELGIVGNKPDENLRRPMHWSPEGSFTASEDIAPWHDYASNLESNNLQTMDADSASLLNRYRSLIRLRGASPALRRGVLVHIPSTSRRVYSYFLYSTEETLLVIHNLGPDLENYGLYIEETPFSAIHLTPVYFGNSEGNFTGQAELAEISRSLLLPELNKAGGFENYTAIPLLEERASYVFRVETVLQN